MEPNKAFEKYEIWFKEKTNGLLVAASLLVAIAFLAALTPPGGTVTQENNYSPPPGLVFQPGVVPPGGVWHKTNESPTPGHHGRAAGMSVMADTNRSLYIEYIFFNSLSFIGSLNTVVLLVSELHLKGRNFFLYFVVNMVVAAYSMACTFFVILSSMIPPDCFLYIGEGYAPIQIVLHLLMASLFFIPFFFLWGQNTDHYLKVMFPSEERKEQEADKEVGG